MCGILGFSCSEISKQHTICACQLTSQLYTEHQRGSDSFGVLAADGKQRIVIKALGEFTAKRSDKAIAAFNEVLPKGAKTWLGHVRASTHGETNLQNAHPILSDNKDYAVVHNGHATIIKDEMEKAVYKNHTINGGTDSESIIHVFEECIKDKDITDPDVIIEAIKDVESAIRGWINFVLLLPDGETLAAYSDGTMEKWEWDKGGIVCVASVELGLTPEKIKWESVPTGTALVIRNGKILKEKQIKNSSFIRSPMGGNRSPLFASTRNGVIGSNKPNAQFKMVGANGLVIFTDHPTKSGPAGYISFIACWECGKNLADELIQSSCKDCGVRFCEKHLKEHLSHKIYAPECEVCNKKLNEAIVCVLCNMNLCLEHAVTHATECNVKYKKCTPDEAKYGKPHKVKTKKVIQCTKCKGYFCKSHYNKHENCKKQEQSQLTPLASLVAAVAS